MALTDGIIGCWSPSIRGSGYLLPDLSGRGNHGTLVNMDAGTDWPGASARGVSGRVLDFDGTNDYVSFGKSPISGSQARTIVVWAKHNAVASGGTNRIIYSCGNTASAGTQFEFGQNGSNGEWYFQGYSANANFTLGDTKWHMHAVGYNGSVLQWWIDGASIGTATLSLNTNGSSHGIGRDIVFNGSFLNGQVGELTIYNRQITAAEIIQIYCSGSGCIGRQLTGQTKRRVYSIPSGPAFKAAWAQRATTIAGVLR